MFTQSIACNKCAYHLDLMPISFGCTSLHYGYRRRLCVCVCVRALVFRIDTAGVFVSVNLCTCMRARMHVVRVRGRAGRRMGG